MGVGNAPQEDRIPGEVGGTSQINLDAGPTPSEEDDLSDIFLGDDEPDTGEKPPVEPPAPQPQQPAVTPPQEGEVTDEAKIDALFERYKNDPRELAKALLHSQQQLSRQGNELGQLRQQNKPAEPAPTPTPVTPSAFQPAAYDPTTEYIKNPAQFQHTEEGYPINPQTGQAFLPKDQYGIPFTPESAWAAKRAILNEQYHDNPVEALHQYNVAVENERLWRNTQFGSYAQAVGVRQQQVADTYQKSLTDSIAAMFPQEIAAEMVRDFRWRAEQGLKNYIASGQAKSDAYQEDALARAMQLTFYALLERGQLAEVAQQARSRVRSGGAVPINGNTESQRRPVQPPPQGSNGAGTKALSKGMERMVQGKMFKPEEVDKYLKDDFEFEGD